MGGWQVSGVNDGLLGRGRRGLNLRLRRPMPVVVTLGVC